MAKNVVKYDLLISCPGDVQDEIDLIKDCVDEFNEKFSDTLGVMVQPRHWKTSSFSQSGGKPQELLNEQFINDCDAAVAVFWTRFGTPTDKYGSGTEEEIEIMLEANRQVFMYFSDKPVPPSAYQAAQIERINEFREKYKDKGIYFPYSSNEDFRKMFFSHLTSYFLVNKQIEEYENRNTPNLVVRGISDNFYIKENSSIRKFDSDKAFGVSDALNNIKKCYNEIDELEIEYTPVASKNALLMYRKVDVSDYVKSVVKDFAEQCSIAIKDDFFDLGGLQENAFGSVPVFGKSLVGGKNEKDKYYKIVELSQKINELVSLIPLEKAFGEMNCLYLALENNGTAIDEDVEITLFFDKDDLLTSLDWPLLEDDDAKYLMENCNLSEVLQIKSSADYASYDEAIKEIPQVRPVYPSDTFFGIEQRDYQEEYLESFENSLIYKIYDKGIKYVVKVHMDYIKHNSVVAFPAPILMKGNPTEVEYQIRSKHIANVIEGKISVEEA